MHFEKKDDILMELTKETAENKTENMRKLKLGRALRSGRRGRRFKSYRIVDSLAGRVKNLERFSASLFYEARIVEVRSTEQFVWDLLTPTSFCK